MYVESSWRIRNALRRSRLATLRCLCVSLILAVGLSPWGSGLQAEQGRGPIVRELDHVALRVKEAEKTAEKRLLSEQLRLHFYGYLNASYTQNFDNPSNEINELRVFDVGSNQPRFNLAQFVLRRDAEVGGNRFDRFGFKVKFDAGQDSPLVGGKDIGPWTDFQEYYLQYLAPVGSGLDVKLGQINSVVGYEVIESPYNGNYSRSWLFGLGQPFTTRGGRVSYDFDKRLSLAIGVIGSINSARGNKSHDPMMESALKIAASDRLSLTLYALAGSRPGAPGTNGGMLVLIGGYVSAQVTDHMSAVIESYYANQANSSTISPAGNARWNGVAGYLLYDITKQWGLRLRGELLEDAGGFVSCGGTTDFELRSNVCFGATSSTPAHPVAQTLWEITATLHYKPFPSVLTRLEFRYDRSNQNTFQIGGRPAGYQPTLSLEVSYLF